jgi:hypothetical protein
MRMNILLSVLALTATLIPLTAQEKKDPQESSKSAEIPKKPKEVHRAGHYIPPQERHLDELITKIRIAQEAGQKYEGKRPMTEAERERARGRRFKAEGGANFRDGIAGAESEYSIATDPTGKNIVVGYNLFADDPNGVSGQGVAYSSDGGQTFRDGGFLPSPANQTAPDGTLLPQILSDPDVKWVPGGAGCNFIYSTIIDVAFPAKGKVTGVADTLGVFRSIDCGQTWAGPFELLPATNPNGFTAGGGASDGADKEFMDVNFQTGRVMLSWSNFTNENLDGVELSVTYSDDIMTGNPPTWAARTIVNTDGAGFATGSVPRFGPQGTQDVYVAYSLSTAPNYNTQNIQVAASHDGGATWSAPVSTRPADFQPMDDVLGNDRVNEFPSMAVDSSSSPYQGTVYVVYSDNNSNDGADVALQFSKDRGKTWSNAQFLNSRPGKDRAQWFPFVTVDKNTGRVSVIFYDQSVKPDGDLTQVLMTFSDDGGNTWSQPTPLTARPFHGGYGNDSSAPNIGDYIGAVAQNGTLYAVWAGTPNSVLFTDGIPGPAMGIPTLFFKTYSGPPSPAVDLGTVTVTSNSADGFLHTGSAATLNVALRNPVTNSATASSLTGVTATLSSSTYGVTILNGQSAYQDLPPDASALNQSPFQIALSSDFNPGNPIDFILDIASVNGTVRRVFTQNTGAPQGTVVFSENFDSVPAGQLPVGWSVAHGAGSNTVPWITNSSFCQAKSNGLFHIDANDGLRPNSAAGSYRWERAFSPIFNIPNDAQWVTVDLDICYDTEDDPLFPIVAYDGAFLRITDQTPNRTLRSVYSDAYAETLTTGSLLGYPKHLADDRTAAYFGDTSAWAGTSGGFQHVTITLPGMAGSMVQLRFEYTQDQSGTCLDVRPKDAGCGVVIDNIVIRSVAVN